MESIFKYRNYSDFLSDKIAAIKATNKRFTYRYIASELGLKSAGHVTQLVKGTASITARHFPILADLLQLKGRERRYFELLVQYGQVPSMAEKREILAKMSRFSGDKAVKVSRDQYQFYQKWYYAAIRDILTLEPFTGDYSHLARMVEPTITRDEAKDAVQTLERLGLITRDEQGVFSATSKILSMEMSEERAVLINGYAEQMIDRAKYALNNQQKDERTISWAGFSTSDEGYALIKEEIKLFRQRVMEIVSKDEASSRVYHMNIDCFPLSKKIDSKGKGNTNEK